MEYKVYFNRDPYFLVGPLFGLEVGDSYDGKYGPLKILSLAQKWRQEDGAYNAVKVDEWERQEGLVTSDAP